MSYLPDTNVCISLMRQRHAALTAKWRRTPTSMIFICSVVEFELRYGAEKSSRPEHHHRLLDEFVSVYGRIYFDEQCARRSGELRRNLEAAGESIGAYDYLIAATALVHGLTLVTHNTREFCRIPGLALEDWEA